MSSRGERGSAGVESTFSILILLFMVLGAIQVALALYGRNVVVTSAHEGARAAIEFGRNPADGAAIARRTVARSAGGLVNDLAVDVSIDEGFERSVVRVRVAGTLESVGPVPLPIPVSAAATSTRTELVP